MTEQGQQDQLDYTEYLQRLLQEDIRRLTEGLAALNEELKAVKAERDELAGDRDEYRGLAHVHQRHAIEFAFELREAKETIAKLTQVVNSIAKETVS